MLPGTPLTRLKTGFRTRESESYCGLQNPRPEPIENKWGILARSVYRDARQVSKVEELKEVISKTCNEISDETCRNLVRSMPKRCADVLAAQG